MDIRIRPKLRQAIIGCMSLMLLNSVAVNAADDFPLGTFSLTPGGTGVITAGKGLEGVTSGDITFTVPTGNTIHQVLLYWEGYTNVDQGIPTPGDSDIMVNGTPAVSTLLGDAVILGNSGELASFAYRADITSTVTPGPGIKTVSITEMDFDRNNDGAGVIVVLDDGTDPAAIAVLEGNDFAYWKATGDLQVTVAQVFNFTPSTEARNANIELMFASVEGDASGGDDRPSAIDVTINSSTTEYNNLLDSADGDEWDAVTLPVTIPANVGSLTVQAFSVDRPPVTGQDPASFHWLAAGLAVTPPPPPPGGEGCTPGFYKNLGKHINAWAGIDPKDLFSDWFADAFPNPDPGMTLIQVLRQGGGGLKALGRHTVAALLNANNGDVDYGMTVAQVQNAFNGVYPADTKAKYTAQKNIFADANESGCPINGKGEYPSTYLPE